RADMILRSSDSVDFFILESFLRIISPVFEDKCSMNQASNGGVTARSRLPVMEVGENSRTLHHLLLLIYPYDDQPPLQDAELFSNVAAAARKYKMTGIEKKLEGYLAGSSLMSSEPLLIYARAISLGWGETAKSAAKSMLSQDLQDMTYVKGLEYITGMDLQHLMEYRFRCGSAASTV
ncbi:hypothetical protein AMATHDRAFT_104187, partial [Amanita thiersii Skay4041]